MSFTLDTSIVIPLLNQTSQAALKRSEQVRNRGHELGISSIVTFELRYGASRSPNPVQNHLAIDRFFCGPFVRLPFDDEDAHEAGEIRTTLSKWGTPIGAYDVLIAGQALRRGLTLVTADVRELKRVPKLKVENWL